MRKLLATAVAIAPLLAAAGAQAEITISDGRTTPIRTANATGSAADDVVVKSGGSITLTSGAAITLDSSNDVTIDNGGKIVMEHAADGATGVLANGGNTGDVTVNGAITITDALDSGDYKDTDNDGDLDGPFAEGTGRYGVRVAGATPLVGDVNIGAGGAIVVEGNESYGLSVEAPLDGSIQSLGSINVRGDDTYGVRVTGDVSGDIQLAGTVQALGENATGVSLEGDVDGAVTVHSAVTVTGYRYTTPPSATPSTGQVKDEYLYLEDLDADDLLQGGPAMSVAGNVAGGVVLDRGPTYASGGADGDDDGDGVKNGDEDDDGDGVKNSEDTDRDGDGIPDASETTASLTSYGSAPALQIGSASQAVTLGAVGDAADNENYGLINRGTIQAAGLYADHDATALRIGVDGGQAVTIEGGVRNEGTISATAKEGAATAVAINAGASLPALVNTGAIQAAASGDDAHVVAGVLVGQGATLGRLENAGTITASFTGNHGDAVAIRDLSGTLTTVVNSGAIGAGLTKNTADDSAVDGRRIAMDLSANTSGVSIRQFGVVDEDVEEENDSDGDGVPNSAEPAIVGDILLGSGADVVSIENGTVVGAIAFGDGADSLTITGGAVVSGAISDTDGLLDIDVANGTLVAGQKGLTDITSLNVGGDSTLVLNIDPESGTQGGFNVSGAATLADGAQLGVRFSSLLDEPERFTVISAGTLNIGDIDQSLLQDNAPYLYVVEADVDTAANEVYIDARRRTADEAGMIKVEASAYDAVYAALGANETLRDLFLSQTGRDGFFDAYEQMLPDHSGGPLMSLSAGVDAVTRALTGRNATAKPGETSAWVQEINFYADKDKTESYGFRSEGFGVAGGVEKGTNLGAVGLSVAFTSSDIEDPEAEAEEVLSANLLELGLYWRAQGQYWTTWARAAGGYASFSADRSLVASGVYLNNTSDWHGWTAAAAAGASYERTSGKWNFRPEVYAEYFHLSEGARDESGGGDGFDLSIDERDSHIFSAVAAMNIGYGFGRNGWLRPELRIGYRQNLSVDAGETIARFRSGGPDFILTPDAIEGGGPILGFRLNFGNELGMLAITGDAELLEDYVRYSLLLRASFRF